jgi:serine/threonine protein kinase
MLPPHGAPKRSMLPRTEKGGKATAAQGGSPFLERLRPASSIRAGPRRLGLTLGAGQAETADAPSPARAPGGQPPGGGGPTRIGELVGGKYRITRYLAEGGMGVVYEAQHVVVKRRFAVKFLRSDFAQRRESLGRFQREAEAAGGLESEHIASVVDFGIATDGSPYLVMEYLVGESLASLLRREHHLPYRRAADLCVQACHGAEAAHAAGIVHRDLKPHNVFVCRREDGTDLLKILDFGIAKLEIIKHDEVSTQTGAVLGTPAYMSPEQARGERTVDPRTDVYSLGAIFFEMLSGRLPHPGDSPNAILYHISTQPAVPIASVAPDLPRSLVEIVDGALASDPGARPQSAKAFAAEVAPFAQREAWPEPPRPAPPARPEGDVASAEKALTAAPAVSANQPGAARGADATSRARGRAWGRAAYVAAAIGLLAVAGVVSGRLLRTGSGPIDTPPPEPKTQVSPTPQDPLRPTEGRPTTPPPEGSMPLSPPPPAAPASAGARALAPTQARAAGRPPRRVAGRPDAASAESAQQGERPATTTQAPSPAKIPFPQAKFDPRNPYGSP